MTEPLILAHQGAWQEVSGPSAANSIAALRAAVALGADGVEVDLHPTSDEYVVLHHDATIGDEDIAAGCAAEKGTPLCELPRGSVAHLADLESALDALAETAGAAHGRRVVCNLELKALPGEPGADRSSLLLAHVASVLSGRPDDERSLLEIVVSCFALDYLERLAGINSRIATAYLTSAAVDQEAAARRAASAGCSALHPAHASTDAELVGIAASLGLRVSPWTVDDPAEAVELARAGVWGIITNEPRRLLAAIRAPE